MAGLTFSHEAAAWDLATPCVRQIFHRGGRCGHLVLEFSG